MHPDDQRPQVFVGRFLFLGLRMLFDSRKLVDAQKGKQESQM
ncbi:hypothetical protein [Coleofasciculus sp. FACHB-1120]|nr:hypothetical protein [Coleofasciculus sp. FACHB-1120]